MGVGVKVRAVVWYVGEHELLNAFFSTASVRLEPAGWGTRFPHLMNELFEGDLPAEHAAAAAEELEVVRAELREHPPSEVVWDVYDRDRRPPWGDDISPDITDLSNYFVTADGEDLIGKLAEALDFAARKDAPARIVTGV